MGVPAGLGIPSFMAIPGTLLALIVGIGAVIKMLYNIRSYSLLPAFLILLLAISPLVLTWVPPPIGILFTGLDRYRIPNEPVCMGTNVTIEGTTAVSQC